MEPLLGAIRENEETIANPIITAIEEHTFSWQSPVYNFMDFDWKMNMKWGIPGGALDMVNRNAASESTGVSGMITGLFGSSGKGQDEEGSTKARSGRGTPDRPWGNADVKSTSSYKNYASPVHAGGIYTASKKFFHQVGGYDRGMVGFSSENLDLAFRSWLCGSEPGSSRNIVVPCSLVGHVYREKSPQASLKQFSYDKVMTNVRRNIEVWLDPSGDGKGYTEDKATGKMWGTCVDGQRCEMPAMLKQVSDNRNGDFWKVEAGDTSERKKWAREHCRPFEWFAEHVSKGIAVND